MSLALKEQARELLRTALGDPTADFRAGQWEAIESLVERQARLLVVQRSGWGKSAVYFLTTRLLRERGAGPTLLVSPLLALMRNQLLAAERLGLRAYTINSTNRDDHASVRTRLLAGQVDILFISPERLANEWFREAVLLPVTDTIGLFVVDEAHCISDWGHDFRPDYLRIVRILQALPTNIPVLATTATANNRVVEDVKEQLGSGIEVWRGPLVRESLRLQNIHLAAPSARMAWLAEQVPRMPGSGIIYALTIHDTLRVASWLRSQGIDAHAYHSKLEPMERVDLEVRLLDNRLKALVATVALGMGFDKPDLGFVIHYQRPGSVVHYYQQVGRAGRALAQAYGVLLGGDDDDDITGYFISTAFPPEAHTRTVMSALRQAEDGLSLEMLEWKVNLPREGIERVLDTLAVRSPSPVARSGLRWYATAVEYEPDREKIEQLTRARYEEQTRMRDYMQSRECLMLFLSRELDDPSTSKCGKCAVCSKPLLPETYSARLALKARERLRTRAHRIRPRMAWPTGALSAHGWHGGEIPPELRAEEGLCLSVWGDGGWSDLVREGKLTGERFDEDLVQAVVEMVERWQPSGPPTWVTCVPSLSHADLVPDFARRVARKLKLPFMPCIRKTRHTLPQKDMENDYQQAHNLESAFEVERGSLLAGPVLLLDDMVDSGWTFTIVAALLRNAASPTVPMPVFPVALVDTSKS